MLGVHLAGARQADLLQLVPGQYRAWLLNTQADCSTHDPTPKRLWGNLALKHS